MRAPHIMSPRHDIPSSILFDFLARIDQKTVSVCIYTTILQPYSHLILHVHIDQVHVKTYT